MKGIVLAGGKGTRLYPATGSVSKQLLPVYDKPMIYYPLSVLMLAGIRDILIISTPVDVPRFRELLGDGSRWGVDFSYATQPEPGGTAEALLIGADFIGDDRVCLILGDNLFYGDELQNKLRHAAARDAGGVLFGYPVSDPERYGVIGFDEAGEVTHLQEKPEDPMSEYAVTGLFFYDSDAVEIARSITPSSRGELELTDINRAYLERRDLHVELFGRGMAWLDTGTHEALLKAANFIGAIQERQGLKIACLEEIAFRNGWVSAEQLLAQSSEMPGEEYAEYVARLVRQHVSDPEVARGTG